MDPPRPPADGGVLLDPDPISDCSILLSPRLVGAPIRRLWIQSHGGYEAVRLAY